MSQPSTSTKTDPTFRTYTPNQASNYASSRPNYPAPLIKLIIDHHTSTGGQFGKFLDIGCGPGNATRDLAGYFDEAVGVDPGEAMIEKAREMGGKTKIGGDVSFVVAEGERISEMEGMEGSVDLIGVATAVHWFDMPKFYAEAAKVLKPGGTLALWTRVSFLAGGFPDPESQHPIELTNLIRDFRHKVLGPYELPGNRLAGDLYDNLPLPWDVVPSVPSFPKEQFKKYDFDRGDAGAGACDADDTNGVVKGKVSMAERRTTTLQQAEKRLSTASPVSRWRKAHPELVGTERDCVKVFIGELREILGGEEVADGFATTVLLFKKVD